MTEAGESLQTFRLPPFAGTHWLADEGWDVPATYGDAFVALAEHRVIERELARRLASASGLRNLVAHQYGAVEWRRVHAIASTDLTDLEAFCASLAARAQ